MAGDLWLVYCGFVCVLARSVAASTATTFTQRNSLDQCSNGVEYPDLGCFTLEEPFTNTAWLPQSPSSNGLTFLLYTRANPVVPNVLSAGNTSSITASRFDSRYPVKFIVHGFLQYAEMEYIANMTRALLNKAPMNVIVVDWGQGAGIPYARAAANTRVVGAATAQLIARLQQVTGIRARQVHIIGHSLGAHIGGYAGTVVPNLGRITGLDPAQPSFSGYGEAVRLDKTDARFVDIVHSDALPYTTVHGYGIIEPIGHMDFYPNGGHHQPGCHEDNTVLDFIEDAVHNGMTDAEVSLSCSHERSAQLFTSSISLSSPSSPCTFQAFPCQSEDSYMKGECLNCGNRPCPRLGLDADKSLGSRGVFYLNTTDSSPFCGHHYFVTLLLGANMTSTDGVVSMRLRGTMSRQLSWKRVKEGRFFGGDRVTNMIVGDRDIGEVNRVDVRFLSRGNRFPWRTTIIVLQMVEVDSVMKFPRKHFCPGSVTVQDDLVVTLQPGTFNQSECPQHLVVL